MTKNKTNPWLSRPQPYSSFLQGALTGLKEVPESPRTIRSNPRSFTGVVALHRREGAIPFESGLERDLIEGLDMDPGIHRIHAQRLCLTFRYGGRSHIYHPDLELECDPSRVKAFLFRKESVVVEVKYQSELDEKMAELAPKLAAAEAFCELHGRQFIVLTENDIRTPFLANAKRFRRYLRNDIDPSIYEVIQNLMTSQRASNIDDLLRMSASFLFAQHEVVDTLFAMIAKGFIEFQLDRVIDRKSPLVFSGQAGRLLLSMGFHDFGPSR